MADDLVGMRDIARAIGKALACSVSERSAYRYMGEDWPTPEEPHPFPHTVRAGDGVRVVSPEALAAWVAWFKSPRTRKRARPEPRGDRRRAPVPLRHKRASSA